MEDEGEEVTHQPGGDPDLQKAHLPETPMGRAHVYCPLQWISGDGGGLSPPPPLAVIWLQSHSHRMAETKTEAEREVAFGDSCL